MKAYERLMEYVKYPTGSTEENDACPSNPKEFDFANALADEMKTLGVEDVDVDEHCYVMGTIPANIENYDGPVLGLIAHIDTSPDAPNENVKPVMHHYEGGNLIINEKEGIKVDAETLKNFIGCDIITSDGTTLLGGDNKAGVAEIMTLAEILHNDSSIKHGTIRIGFTPDEEIGRSSDLFDLDKFGADCAYTIDGDLFGECQSETFSAMGSKVTVNGVGVHPGFAKNAMINALHVAEEFDDMLPRDERPEYTAGREGFYHLVTMSGGVEKAVMNFILRDFDWDLVEKRADMMNKTAEFLNHKYGEGTVVVENTEQYHNMGEIIEQHPKLTEIPLSVIREMGYEPDTAPIRGGTDGAFLSFRGLPCPNLGPGGSNFHGRSEFAVVQDMEKATEMITKVVQKIAEVKKSDL
ncbi:MAG: peptidase T [Eubacterium sp.]|jgi:tripeptide aminopeptidase|nr:peptidase T [Eubacterium sp.]MCI2196577.1 peptidase T [Eubacterium sp.]